MSLKRREPQKSGQGDKLAREILACHMVKDFMTSFRTSAFISISSRRSSGSTIPSETSRPPFSHPLSPLATTSCPDPYVTATRPGYQQLSYAILAKSDIRALMTHYRLKGRLPP